MKWSFSSLFVPFAKANLSALWRARTSGNTWKHFDVILFSGFAWAALLFFVENYLQDLTGLWEGSICLSFLSKSTVLLKGTKRETVVSTVSRVASDFRARMKLHALVLAWLLSAGLSFPSCPLKLLWQRQRKPSLEQKATVWATSSRCNLQNSKHSNDAFGWINTVQLLANMEGWGDILNLLHKR